MASDGAIQSDPQRLCGVPTVGAFRFSVAQLLAEIADGRSITEVADHFDLPLQLCTDVVKEIASSWAIPHGPLAERDAEIRRLREEVQMYVDIAEGYRQLYRGQLYTADQLLDDALKGGRDE